MQGIEETRGKLLSAFDTWVAESHGVYIGGVAGREERNTPVGGDEAVMYGGTS